MEVLSFLNTVTMVFDSQDDAAAYLKMNEIKKDIEAFEKKHGTIEGSIRPDVNVKPSGKHG